MRKLSTLFLSLLTVVAFAQDIVISGVYGGGGNSKATYKSDYIEFYNNSTSDVNIGGYKIYYASATGVTSYEGNNFIFPENTIMKAKSFFSLRAADGSSGGVEWPAGTFDFEVESRGAFALSSSNGKLILLNTNTDLSADGAIPTTLEAIKALKGFVDYLPFGNATPVYGGSSVSLTNTTALSRKIEGTTIVYTGNIANDFAVISANVATAVRNSNTVVNVKNQYVDSKNIFVQNGTLNVTNAKVGAAFAVYNSLGKVVTNGVVNSSNFNYSLPTKGIYVVKIGNNTTKIMF